jgi:DNA-binding MarR family transcriptional regulator
MTTRRELDRKFIAAIERLGRALRVARQQIATNHQISILQLRIIELLSDGRARRVGELANELDVTQPTISDSLLALEEKRILNRTADPTDRRASVLSLTETGSDLAVQVALELSPLLDGDRTTSDDDQATALVVTLEEIRRLQANGTITVNRSCLTCQHYQPPTPAETGSCLLLRQRLGSRDLRVDCPDHLPV